MKIEMNTVPEMTIEQFADKHGLVMEVHERRGREIGDPARFYACFKSSWISEPPMLRGGAGDGATPEKAIINYGKQISSKTIVIDAGSNARRDIAVPRIVPS